MARVVRATSWALAAFGLSTGAHVVGGGALPSSGSALVMALALLWTGLVLTGRRLGPITLTLSLAASQLLLHLILTASEATAACVAAGGHHDMVLACSGGAPMSHHNGAAMLLAHATATIVLALLLARGEETIWFLAGRLWPRLPRRLCLPSLAREAIAPVHVVGLTTRVTLLGGVGRRGPPPRPARRTG